MVRLTDRLRVPTHIHVIALISVIALCAGIKFEIKLQSTVLDHLLFHLCHANIFHLSLNLWALYAFKPRLHTVLRGWIIATICSAFPISIMDEATSGMSALLLTCYAKNFYYHSLSIVPILLCNAAMAFIPHCNWKIHLLAFFASYLYWLLRDTWRTLKFYHII